MVTLIADPIAPGQAGFIGAIRRRNMGLMKQSGYKERMLVRTTNRSSPIKVTAQNRVPSQAQSRAPLDEAIKRELAEGRMFTPDLADHMFGHLVSTELAKYILEQLIADKVVELHKGGTCVPPGSPDAKFALENAFKEARAQGLCSNKDDVKKAIKAKKGTSSDYSFSWVGFPPSASNEDKLVEFLNQVTDLAWEAALPKLDSSKYKLRNRFAVPKDKKHAVPLSYEPDGEDMRPDFLVLPIEAFSEDMKTVDEKYMNFTTALTVGEMKASDLGSGLTQVHRYARGLRRAQPWVHFVVALTVTKDKAALLRGDGSGTERLEWALSHGRGCIEFIRIILGLALAEPVDLGQNPDVELRKENISTSLAEQGHPDSKMNGGAANSTAPSEVGSSTMRTHGYNLRSGACRSVGKSYDATSSASKQRISSKANSEDEEVEEEVPILIRERCATRSSASKRSRADADLDFEDKDEGNRRRKKKKSDPIELAVFVPFKVYDHKCYGILFASSSIRGRGTTVFCVVDLEDDDRLLALKMSWQDLEREVEQQDVMDLLEKQRKREKLHPNIIIPIKTFKASKNGKDLTTLGGIRDIPDDRLAAFQVENRVLTISLSELKRPTKYFWGAHDFVRGLRAAVLGHEHLTSIGILHRDISENNIVLGRRPGEERGYLIDFDMAILQDAKEEIPDSVPVNRSDDEEFDTMQKSSSPIPVDKSRPLKAFRTGTTPYMSFNVLNGKTHTYHDDLESFLYVLLFFFLSYVGPLSKKVLKEADGRGFTQNIGSGRLPHIRPWPEQFNSWAEGDLKAMASRKKDALTPEGTKELTKELKKCLENVWPGLSRPINILLWKCWRLFANSRLTNPGTLPYTKVEHCQFVEVLDKWLEEYGALEGKYSNCPFQ